MKSVLIFLIILFTAMACQQQMESTYEPVTQFDPARDAGQDLNLAVVEAQRSGKRILLDVGGTWCIWCRKLDAFFEEHHDVKAFMENNYVVVKINYSKENKNEEFLAQFPKVPGYPHFFVLNSDGSLLHSQDTGKLEAGDGHDHDKVLAFLQKWAPEKIN